MNYFSDERHKLILWPYGEAHFKNEYFLVFTKDWMHDNLPKDSTMDGFKCVLLDSDTGQKIECKQFVAYSEFDWNMLDINYYSIKFPLYCLMPYFYSEHYCACHRKMDAKRAGINIDEECEGNRFKIERITPPNSDLILMSETFKEDELIALLTKGRNING